MQIFNKLVRVMAWLSAFLFVAAGVMLTYEVVARYFFTKPTIWAAELSQLCLIWGSLLAMAWALGERRHIAVDAVVNLLSPKVRRWTDAGAMLFVAWLSAMVVWKGGDIFLDSFERGRTTGSMLDLPSWVAELSVPFGFAMLFVQALFEAARAVGGHGREPDHIAEGGHFE
ncbi:TRAP transporter small permease [Hwanghaeella sp.]|uniref:TRAP transporter small permease n=1 Tax=Hwanghaeella sp. TaxID=2605943 RepID=UPI003CCBD721